MPATQTLLPTPDGFERAAQFLQSDQLVAFPTETVYGLGGDARSDIAVAGIYAAKGRPTFNPLIIHVADIEVAQSLAHFDSPTLNIARAFWPGPLTLVLPIRAGSGLSALAMAGLPSVALRVPAHPVAQALLRAFGGPVAAPSANPSGRISPTRADHVMDGLAGHISAVIDGGPCSVGVESTILSLVGPPLLLRPGGIPVEVLEAALGQTLAIGGDADRPTSPGQMASHYAPMSGVRLDATHPLPGEVMIGFGSVSGALTLSPHGDMAEAAAALFHTLRVADAMAGPGGRIAVAPVPERGLGRAINDRLRRAAAPRS